MYQMFGTAQEYGSKESIWNAPKKEFQPKTEARGSIIRYGKIYWRRVGSTVLLTLLTLLLLSGIIQKRDHLMSEKVIEATPLQMRCQILL